MQKPLEIRCPDLPPAQVEVARELVQGEVAKLETIADDIVSCRVAMRLSQRNHRHGNRRQIRIQVSLPPGHDLVVTRESSGEDASDPVGPLVRRAFQAMSRRIVETRRRRRGEVKAHEELRAFVSRLFPDQGYGFLTTDPDAATIYFHRNSVLGGDYDRLTVGTQVRYVPEEGAKGLQASTVQIVDKPSEGGNTPP
jgi:cold shock CspA family protein